MLRKWSTLIESQPKRLQYNWIWVINASEVPSFGKVVVPRGVDESPNNPWRTDVVVTEPKGGNHLGNPHGGQQQMSEDHGCSNQISHEDPLFLSVKPGMTVVITEKDSWWMGDVLFMEGGARNPRCHPVPNRLHRYRQDPLGQCDLVAIILCRLTSRHKDRTPERPVWLHWCVDTFGYLDHRIKPYSIASVTMNIPRCENKYIPFIVDTLRHFTKHFFMINIFLDFSSRRTHRDNDCRQIQTELLSSQLSVAGSI